MQDLIFVSEDYNKRKPKDYRLSISIRRDGFSFLIMYKQQVLAYSYTTVSEENRKTAFKSFLEQEILQEKFAAVTFIIVTPKFTLVPKKMYDDSMWELYSDLNFKKSDSESVISYESENSDVVVLFPIETDFWALCRTAFKEQHVVSYVPQVAPLLEKNIKTRQEKLCISVESSFFTAMLVKGKKLMFCNSFEFSNVNDFLFYVMNIVEQLHLDPQSLQIELSGKISGKSSYFSAIQMFVKNVSMVENDLKTKNFPFSLFYNHCNIALCE
ncbi:MAG: DUF3822 family protein [Bacteroidales bacterium]|nr:DUF3822 family protein [Bacteroidales bacterium]